MRSKKRFLVRSIVSIAALCACATDDASHGATGAAEESVRRAAEGITAPEILAHIRVLASDEFEGRAPGTRGEDRTVEYLTRECQAIGLEPGNPDGTYVQRVPLTGFKSDARGSFRAGGREIALERGVDAVLMTRWIGQDVVIEDSGVVFVGYGVVAPEYGWDDYKDVDVRGKTIVMLVNDPQVPDPADPARLDAALFKANAMTYYGRWTYKFEIAARKGASAAVIVHQTSTAGYPWAVVQSSWGKENFDLESPEQGRDRAAIESWITLEKAMELCAAAGQDFKALERLAATKEFRPVPLAAKASFRARNASRSVASQNVVAKLTGSDPLRSDEYVVYTAHWDHLGRDESAGSDTIWNGAVDNASGCAGLLEIAQAFSKLDARPARTIVFLWVTAEEKGLLGSRYYAEHPLYPLARTLCNINMDSLNPWGRTSDVISIGLGMSTLDDVLQREATACGRTVGPDADPSKGIYYRSDHFEFAKRGVPGLYADSGSQFIGRPAGFGKAKQDEYTEHDYHKTSDEVREDWDLTGAAEDMALLFRVGLSVASGADWPEWSPTSEFRAVREQSLRDAQSAVR